MMRQEVDVIEVGWRAYHYGDFENAGSASMMLELLTGTHRDLGRAHRLAPREVRPLMPDFAVGTTRFCIYCQREFSSRRRFENHVVSQHAGTYAYWSLREGRI